MKVLIGGIISSKQCLVPVLPKKSRAGHLASWYKIDNFIIEEKVQKSIIRILVVLCKNISQMIRSGDEISRLGT